MLLAFFLKGILVGAVIAVPVGPVGVLCVRRTIFEGRLAGLASGLGAATADAIFGIIAGFGLTFIADWLLGWEALLRVGGGAYLVYIGGAASFAAPEAKQEEETDPEGLARDFASTFALSVTNPVTILAFLGIFAALGLSGARATLGRATILVLGVWLGSMLWWLALSLGIAPFRRSIGQRHLAWISRGSGIILLLSGVALLVTAAVKHFA
ncbi:MAG TPA: LysE family transporter [Stellaceae bacterium]|jgi:threonine/homoserine/homoserine lactone efflux protein